MPTSRKPHYLRRSGLWLAAAAIAAWSFFPIYWMILSSLRSQTDLFAVPSLVPRHLTLDSYRTLLELSDYSQQFMNSLIVALSVVVITVIISIAVAYVLTRF
jgi:multiple sugar transport system permease protein